MNQYKFWKKISHLGTDHYNDDDIMDIYTIDQVSEVLFANILPLIIRSLTVGPKNRLGVGWANDEDNSFMQKCKKRNYAMLINGSFCYSGQNQSHKNPFKTWWRAPIAIMLHERDVSEIVSSCQDTAWHWIGLRILYQIPKRGDSSVMFEIPK